MEDETIIADEGFEDFAAAFGGEDGNQTEETTEGTEEVTETTPETDSVEESEGESQEEDTEDGSTEDGAEAPPAAQETSFTIRVNKEDRVVNREEMFSLAQKGADYDRVKGQVAERDKTISELTSQIEGNKDSLEMLSLISESVGKPIPELLETLHVSLRMKNGETEAEAKANIRAIKAERQINAAKAEKQKQAEKPDQKARAEKEVADFHSRFPGVELSEELCKELTEDVRKGMTIADAYQKREDARKDARIAELERQLAADKQNKKNKAKAVGSQTDSGGRRTKSAEDDFFAAFEK
jgi:hypothetical protein